MKKRFLKPNHQLLLLLLAWFMVAWSWILLVDATTLTNATVLSYLIRAVVYSIHVGLSVAIFYQVAKYFLCKYHQEEQLSWTFLAKFFVMWALTEWLVAWLLSLIWFGDGASFDTVSPFSSLTPILMYTPLKFLARFVGFYGLSAFVVTVGISVYAKKLRRFALPLMGIMLVLGLSSWLFYNAPTGRTVKVVTSSEKLSENIQIKTNATLAVLPEYGLDQFKPEASEQRILPTNNQEVFFVGSQLTKGELGLYNTLLFGSTKQGVLLTQDKTRLVAGGEYLPFIVKVPLVLARQTETLDAFQKIRSIVRGDQQIKPLKIDDQLVLGSEVCSSIISPEDYRRLTHEGSTLLTNSASLGVFGGSRVYRILHNGMARFHAVANSRPFVQSAIDETAYMLDHNGHELATASPLSIAEHEITTTTKTTPYTLLGEWPVYAGVAYIAFLAVMVWRKRSHHKP